MTALHRAAYKGCKDVVTTLLTKGANPSITNKEGKTPRDLASDENIIQLLRAHEEKVLESQKKKASNIPVQNGIVNTINKSIMIGSVCGVIAALAVSGGCFAAGVALPMLALISIAVSAALVIGVVLHIQYLS